MHQEDALILTLKKMTFQLRQDYVNMLLHETPTLYRGRQAINDAYHFAFPEGTYFAFILSAGSKVAGEEPRSLWFTLAQQHIRKHLVDFCEDFEIMSIGNRVHCIGGTTHSQQEISKKLTGISLIKKYIMKDTPKSINTDNKILPTMYFAIFVLLFIKNSKFLFV